MSRVTEILDAVAGGTPRAAEALLPLVYDELRKLAAQRLAQEKPGQTLQATALVHEAYLRLIDDQPNGWDGRGHFFAAAAEAMRRILVDQARRRSAAKRGGQADRVELRDSATWEQREMFIRRPCVLSPPPKWTRFWRRCMLAEISSRFGSAT